MMEQGNMAGTVNCTTAFINHDYPPAIYHHHCLNLEFVKSFELARMINIIL